MHVAKESCNTPWRDLKWTCLIFFLKQSTQTVFNICFLPPKIKRLLRFHVSAFFHFFIQVFIARPFARSFLDCSPRMRRFLIHRRFSSRFLCPSRVLFVRLRSPEKRALCLEAPTQCAALSLFCLCFRRLFHCTSLQESDLFIFLFRFLCLARLWCSEDESLVSFVDPLSDVVVSASNAFNCSILYAKTKNTSIYLRPPKAHLHICSPTPLYNAA